MTDDKIKKCLSISFSGEVDNDKINLVKYYFYEFNRLFCFEEFEVVQIINKFPALLSLNKYGIINNFNVLGKTYNIKSFEFKSLIIKTPNLLIVPATVLSSKIELLKATFNYSLNEVLRVVFVEPKLFELSKHDIENQIQMLSTELDQYGLAVRKLFRIEYRLLFVDKKQISSVKRYFMKSFGLEETEVMKVIKAVPSIVFNSVQELSKKFNCYYPNLFIKRDIKEILDVCPEFVLLQPTIVQEKILQLEEYFEVSQKKACDFVRRYPDILFYKDITVKLRVLEKLNISKKYLFVYPECLSFVEFMLPVKFMLSRILGLENSFSQFEKIKTVDLFQRFMFLQDKNAERFDDLILAEDLFVEKHLEFIDYKNKNFIEKKALFNICELYFNLKNEISNWKDIPFPALSDIVGYINKDLKIEDVIFLSTNNLIEKNLELLKILCLTQNEIDLIINKNKDILKANDFSKIVIQLIKYGYSYDEVSRLLMRKPDLFLYPIFDFILLVDEIQNSQNSLFEIIENIL
ncbi:MAG: hypothetical protein IKC11_05285 [Clostridia bacterium]|nr:hypothetical protein [Clostridia bacterium]